MKRRDFITLLCGATAATPFAARAQQPAAIPIIGFLYLGSPEASASLLAAFRKGLSESGYVEGKNVAIEYRWAHNDNHRLPELAADLVRRQVAVMVAPGNSITAVAAKAATTTIPIVFSTGADPVQAGLVTSLNRPGGNVTGVSYMNLELSAKRLGLLHELRPGGGQLGVLVEDVNPVIPAMVADLRAAALTIGRQIEVLTANSPREIETAFAALAQKRLDGLLISPIALFFDRRIQVLTLAARYVVPVIYPAREWAELGGMISYGSSYADLFRQGGVYTGRVLKGEKPADMPVLRATRFELVINLQTASALGIDIPGTLLARADEVIE
jgi:putative ABC transport system substrate-binding protein